MKKIILLVLVFFMAMSSLTFGASVRGHWRDTDRDGIKDTYVQPYQRTTPNSTIRDNYNYPGNYNPNTGRITPGNPNTYEENYQRRLNKYGW